MQILLLSDNRQFDINLCSFPLLAVYFYPIGLPVLKLNPDMTIIPISARTGEGMDEWIDWLKEETSSWNESNEKGVKE